MSVGEPAKSALEPLQSPPRRPGRGGEQPARVLAAGAADGPATARFFAELAAALLGFVLPVLMVLANKSAPATLAAAALSANAAALAAGRAPMLRARYAALLRAPTTLLTLGIVALCAFSFAWTVDPRLTRRGLVEGVPVLLFAFALAAAWPLVGRRGDARWLFGGVAAAGLLILFEHAAGMPLHTLVRARGEAWDLKRSAVPPLLLLWPAAALLWPGLPWPGLPWPGRRFTARAVLAGLAASVTVGIAASHSGAPGAALAAGAALFVLALAAPRLAIGLAGAGLAVLIVAAPWTGSVLTRALPPDARQELREEHAEHRLAIWTAFERRGFDRPWLGHGFDASFAVAEAPRPGRLPPPSDSARIVGFHPHDVMLQFWIEGGALGLAAASVAFCFAMGRLWRRRGPPLAARLGLLAAAVGVGLVGLSAWQPWWIASTAAALLWFDRGERFA